MTPPAISVLCPTRARPDNVRRLIESARQTAAVPDRLEFVFYFDDDDRAVSDVAWMEIEPGLKDAQWRRVGRSADPDDWVQTWESGPIKVLVGPRIVLSRYWNICYEHSSALILMQCGDDIVFRTTDWDLAVVREFAKIPDRIALVYGDDGIQHAGVATHGFLHRRWAEVVGYFVPPHFASDYNDLWLTEVARALGRLIYLPGVYTEHMHPVAGKGPMDITHRERLHRHNVDNCDAIWSRTGDERQTDIAKLQAYIDGFAQRAAPQAQEVVI